MSQKNKLFFSDVKKKKHAINKSRILAAASTYPKAEVFFSIDGGWAPGSGMSWMWMLEGA